MYFPPLGHIQNFSCFQIIILSVILLSKLLDNFTHILQQIHSHCFFHGLLDFDLSPFKFNLSEACIYY